MREGSSPPGPERVCVVLLNWNGWRDTVKCLASLGKLSYPDYEVVVVDNGSTDGSPEKIHEAYPDVTLLRNGRNSGFAGGNNEGIQYALARGADHVWLLNNDTVADPAALGALVDVARDDPGVGAIGSVLYHMQSQEEIQVYGGGWVRWWMGTSRAFVAPVPDGELQYVMGASMLIRREALEGLGFLDDGFFMYWEDTDYGFRLRKAGWRLAVAADSRVWHSGSSVPSEKNPLHDAYFNASAVRFFKKHYPLSLILVLVGVGGRFFKRLVRRDWKRAKAVLRGALTVWR